MNSLKKRLDPFLISLIAVGIFLCSQNYASNTFLSGWDTLHPEFNFSLYLQRITLFWQEHQGLGAPPSQSHAGEIPRVILLWLISLFLPINLIRYFYFFLMIIIGPIGIYLLLIYLFKQKNSDSSTLIKKISAFLGSLFYLLNLGTVQNFIVPLEMFATKFGLLGFLYFLSLKFLNEKDHKSLFFFSLFIFLNSASAHTATLWYVFFISFLFFLIGYSLLSGSLEYLKRSIIIIFLTLLINLYWLIPNFYYASNYHQDLITSKTHRLGSEEFFYHNKKYGNLGNFLVFKNFLFNWYVTTNEEKIKLLLENWKNHLENRNIVIIGYSLSFFSLLGIIFSIIKKNNAFVSFLPGIALSSFFLLSDIKFISELTDYLRDKFPLFREVFRFPFTKFSLSVIFYFSLFFGFFNYFLFSQFGKLKLIKEEEQKKFLVGNYFFLLTTLIFILISPAFIGNFISPMMRVRIPDDYFLLFKWLENQKEKRILGLPINDRHGWSIYRWDLKNYQQVYQGAGFIWFGIKQSLINPEFNRWYPYNEQSFREFFYAIYSQNKPLFEKLLQKYNIGYILLDEHVIVPGEGHQSKKLFYREIKQLLSQLETIKLVKNFGEKISVYEYLPNQQKKPLELIHRYKIIEPTYRWNYLDQAYLDYGNYVSKEKTSKNLFDGPDVIFLGRDLLNNEEKINQKIVSVDKDRYFIRIPTELFPRNGDIKIPPLNSTEKEIYTEVYAGRAGNEVIIELKYLLPYIKTDRFYSRRFITKSENTHYFSLNEKTFSIPKNLSERMTLLGEGVVFPSKNNLASFFSGREKPVKQKEFSSSISPFLCSPPAKSQIFGFEKNESSFKLFGQQAQVCLEIPLEMIIDTKEEGLLEISFNYESENKGENEVCLVDREKKGRCLVRKKPNPSLSSEVKILFPFSDEKFSQYQLRFSYDTRKAKEIKELLIKNLTFKLYERVQEERFTPVIPKFNQTTDEIILEGKFPQTSIPITWGKIGDQINDCTLGKAKSIKKNIIPLQYQSILEYQAVDGAICDRIDLSEISQNIGYLLAIESRNVSGLPLKICLEDKVSGICNIEERLSKNKDFSFDFFLLPPFYQSGGYDLIINNYSPSNLPTQNQIRTIRFIPFPYNFLQSIRWENPARKSNDFTETSPASKYQSKKIFPFLYELKFDAIKNQEPIIFLDQAFEKNWKAYLLACSNQKKTCFAKKLFPFLFGREIQSHLIVNNWANGWRIERSLFEKTKNQASEVTIAIVFLPQYLQFLGFGIMFFGLVIIAKIKDL
ncbi:MAG: hypothetical protein NZL96_02270 [Patescibacteria group bacterium]|nr:hypothetical protein [Patescibacteria group bacterium]